MPGMQEHLPLNLKDRQQKSCNSHTSPNLVRGFGMTHPITEAK